MSSLANRKHGEISIWLDLVNAKESYLTIKKIVDAWVLKFGEMVPKNKSARSYFCDIKAYSIDNAYNQTVLILFTKTNEFYSRISIRSSAVAGGHGVFHAWTSPRKKQLPVELMKEFLPFLIETCGLPHIDSVGIECIDIAVDISMTIKKSDLAFPVFLSKTGIAEDCYVETAPGSKLFILRDEILCNEKFLRATIMYLSCPWIKRILLGLWKRPWRQ